MPAGHTITQATLARRLTLLLDAHRVQGRPTDFPTISAAVTDAGAKLSRARWAYVRNEKSAHTPRDTEFMRALAEFFDVPLDYLTSEDAPIPASVTAALDDVREAREAEVIEFATAQLKDLAPDKLARVTDALTRAS